MPCEGDLGCQVRNPFSETILQCRRLNDCFDRQHLKTAFDLASLNQDNHLRALTLAFVSSHFFHTDGTHAMNMLTTCEQLAAGLGATARKGEETDVAGSASLRLWVGERFLGALQRQMRFFSDRWLRQNCTRGLGRTLGWRNRWRRMTSYGLL